MTPHQITHAIESALGGGDFSCKQCNRVTKIVKEHIEAARADGYRAGVEASVSIAQDLMARLNTDYRYEIADAIRALAPAAKTEDP